MLRAVVVSDDTMLSRYLDTCLWKGQARAEREDSARSVLDGPSGAVQGVFAVRRRSPALGNVLGRPTPPPRFRRPAPDPVFGQPQTHITWQLTPRDLRTDERSTSLFKNAINRLGGGVVFSSWNVVKSQLVVNPLSSRLAEHRIGRLR